MPMTDITTVIDTILAGQVDAHLDAITGAVQDRKDTKARSLFHTISTGDRATLKNLRPKYMIGVPVIVVSKAQTRINVKIDPEYLAAHGGSVGRFGGFGPISCTPDMLDVTS